MKKLLTTKEASKITGYSKPYIRQLVKMGRLKVIRNTPISDMRFLEEDLMHLTHAPEQFPKVKDPGK